MRGLHDTAPACRGQCRDLACFAHARGRVALDHLVHARFQRLQRRKDRKALCEGFGPGDKQLLDVAQERRGVIPGQARDKNGSIRLRSVFSIYTAWCLLLERQGRGSRSQFYSIPVGQFHAEAVPHRHLHAFRVAARRFNGDGRDPGHRRAGKAA